MIEWWQIDANRIAVKDSYSIKHGELFGDLVLCKKHQQAPHGISCRFTSGKVVAIDRAVDVVTAQKAQKAVLCHFLHPLTSADIREIESIGGKQLRPRGSRADIVGFENHQTNRGIRSFAQSTRENAR